MKQRIFLLTLLFLLILTRTNDISAKETKLNEDMFTNVENTLKDKEINLSYTQLVKQLIHGNVKGVLHTIKAKMKEVFLPQPSLKICPIPFFSKVQPIVHFILLM